MKKQKITAQYLFDRVAIHLLLRNKKSKSAKNNICLYRSKDWHACAAGCLISDENYDAQLEQKGSWQEIVVEAIEKSINGSVSKHETLLGDLQFLHDTSHPNTWKRELLTIADRNNLSVDAIDFALEYKRGQDNATRAK